MLTQTEFCGMIAVAYANILLLWGCGCSGGGSPPANIIAKPRLD